MGDKTGIQWTDATWNPVTGCSKVSAGCKNCYAERDFPRAYSREFHAITGAPRKFTDVLTHPSRLDQPLHWRRPRRVFVNSMSDLFHEEIPDTFILEVLDVIRRTSYDGGSNVGKIGGGCGEHAFQVLTKRPERMRDLMSRLRFRFNPRSETESALYLDDDGKRPVVLKNLWLGVSCEDQATADERIPLLLETPAAVRFVSAEPLLGRLSFHRTLGVCVCTAEFEEGAGTHAAHCPATKPRIDWVIVGGESGPGARECDVEWIRSIVGQCREASVPCFVKQLGANVRAAGSDCTPRIEFRDANRRWPLDLRDRKGGDPGEWPADLRVREFPFNNEPPSQARWR